MMSYIIQRDVVKPGTIYSFHVPDRLEMDATDFLPLKAGFNPERSVKELLTALLALATYEEYKR